MCARLLPPPTTTIMSRFLSILTSAAFVFQGVLGALSNFDDWPHLRVQLDDVSIHARYYGSGPPILLVHGFPQHSLTWHTIGPILAQNYTVIAPDIRGMGDSSLPKTGKYTAQAAGADLKGLLDFLNIKKTYVFSHDKGVGLAASLDIENPGLVKRHIMSEYVIPGFGYPTAVTSPDLYMNWQLAFFAVPDAAEFFISGKEKQMLSWYFFHASYSGTASITEDHLNRYTSQISKPGFLRAGLNYFGAAFEDADYFTAALSNGTRKIQTPILALGGEASLSPLAVTNGIFSAVADNVVAEEVPKAGHWLGESSKLRLLLYPKLISSVGDENPIWVAKRAVRFFSQDMGIPSVDLSWLTDKVTLGV